ncbi:MAG: hypothetical protein M3521_13795 [Acidobacteriota bacterium]|jgi:hypothetical protein|nr:hypothetical protein [Acidobacteriota bacterium]
MIVTKETIKEEVEKVPKERLNELYEVIKDFSQPKKKKSKEEFLANLQKIRIDAPPDFAANIDEYLYGGKDFGENLR